MLAAMIFPRDPQTAADVGGHYDELDETYRSIWGEHVHHGYWRTGRETPEQATEDLVGLVAERLDLQPGMALVDIGCGYGATAAQHTLGAISLVQLFGRQRDESKRFAGRANDSFRAGMRLGWQEHLWPLAQQSLFGLGAAIVIAYGGYLVYQDQILRQIHNGFTTGDLLVFCAWTMALYEPLGRITGFTAGGREKVLATRTDGVRVGSLAFSPDAPRVIWTNRAGDSLSAPDP